MLRADNLSYSYGRTPVVRNVSLRVGPGDLVGILGPNGSGKTTLLRLLAGLLPPLTGQVLLDEVGVWRLPREHLARRMAVVPQETHLAFDYSVLEIALMGRYPHLGPFQFEGPGDLALARQALALTGTAALEGRPFGTLSGGEKQRVIIASALAQFDLGGGTHSGAPPPHSLLLLDEPTASLDLRYQLEIAAVLKDLHASRPLSIIVSTHDLNFAAGLCRDLILLRDGQVLASGRIEEVLTATSIQELYGVRADVRHHDGAGHLTVVPMGRAGSGSSEARS